MSNQRSPVHAANTAAWKPFDFLSLSGDAQAGFSGNEFRSEVVSGFQRARVEALPDNSLRAPARWRPPSHSQPSAEATGVLAALPAPVAHPSATGIDAQQAEDIRAQAFEAGLEQGRREGEAAALEQLQAQQQADQAQTGQALQDLLIQVGESVAQLAQHADTLHEPLKRLALHLAEELVLGELSLSANAIDRLVQRCVDALDGQGAQQLVVELHPDDLAMLQQHPDAEADRPSGWVWQANPDLLPGSVRVRKDEAVVSDLIEHRLQALAKQLLGQTSSWSARSSFEPSRLAERRRQDHPVEDALPRMGRPLDSQVDDAPPAWAAATAVDTADMRVTDTPSDEDTDDTPAPPPEASDEDGHHD